MKRGLALVLIAAAPVLLPALAPGVQAAHTGTGSAQLAGALLPEAAIVDLATALLDRQRGAALAADPAASARYAAHPGMQAFVSERMRREVAPVVRAALPELRQSIRGILDESMTPAEVAAALAFLATPAGQRLHTTMISTLGAGETQVDATTIFNLLVRNTPLLDYPTVLNFLGSSAGQKIAVVQPKIATASQAWSDELLRKNDAKLQRAVARAERAYLKERK